MTVDFDNEEQYRKFVKDVAEPTADFCMNFYDDLEENIATQIILRHKDELADAIFDRLIERCKK